MRPSTRQTAEFLEVTSVSLVAATALSFIIYGIVIVYRHIEPLL